MEWPATNRQHGLLAGELSKFHHHHTALVPAVDFSSRSKVGEPPLRRIQCMWIGLVCAPASCSFSMGKGCHGAFGGVEESSIDASVVFVFVWRLVDTRSTSTLCATRAAKKFLAPLALFTKCVRKASATWPATDT